MKPHLGMLAQPPVMFGLMGVKVVQHHVDFLPRVSGHDVIHEIQELPPPPPAIMPRLHLAAGDIQGGKEGAGAVTGVIMLITAERLATGQAQPPLLALQCLKAGFFIHGQHNGIVRRVQIKAHNVRRFLGKFRIGGDTPAAPPGQADAQAAQFPPDLMSADVAQCPR